MTSLYFRPPIRFANLAIAARVYFSGASEKRPCISAKIYKTNVIIVYGDITALRCDAYVVPQHTRRASYGGVNAAICSAGGEKGIDEFQAFVTESGEQKVGIVLLTPSGGGQSKYLLHVICRQGKFNTVQQAMFNVLKFAELRQLSSIVAPALGAELSQLTPNQSAKAMLSAVYKFAQEGGKMNIGIVLDSPENYENFVSTLKDSSYEIAKH